MLKSKLLFASQQLWLHRAYLRIYLKDPSKRINSVTQLNSEQLELMGIRAVIFDFDGVLATHGAIKISPMVAYWLRDFIKNYTGQIFLLSNNLFKKRIDYLSTNWPELKIVTPKKKKPDPDGILEISRITGLLPQKILMIDDRLGTGLLAARLAGINGLLVNPALVNYTTQPGVEMFFASLRVLERLICLI